ncbi:MAG TPA: hypothetical protein VMH50_08430 [Thermoleophilia bacterium]|nr:hypothetical protein [Thermoleophilia bacterium]
MSRTPTRAVQVRLPLDADEFLTALALARGESKTKVVVEALACLREQLVERRMEAGYRELAGEDEALVRAAVDATLSILPD